MEGNINNTLWRGLLATIFGLTAKSTTLRVYWIVVGGLTIKEAWREYQEDRKGAVLYMILGGVAILNSLLGFLGLKLL